LALTSPKSGGRSVGSLLADYSPGVFLQGLKLFEKYPYYAKHRFFINLITLHRHLQEWPSIEAVTFVYANTAKFMQTIF
jgi:hypothetical protein